MLVLKSHYRVINKATSLIFLICAIFCIAGESQAYKTRAEIEAKARAGDREAMFDHANCHNDPICAGYTTRNVPEAIKWFERAAKLGQRDANLMLGMLLCREPGYQNPPRGRKYLDKAIELGLGAMATPLKKSCGKGNGKQDQDPNIMIEMLMKQARAKEKIIKSLKMLQEKEFISANKRNEIKKYFEKASVQEVFIYWGAYTQGVEEFLNAWEGGHCTFTKYHKVVLGEMGIKPNLRSSIRMTLCGGLNMKRAVSKVPESRMQCTSELFLNFDKKRKRLLFQICHSREFCEKVIDEISRKHCDT